MRTYQQYQAGIKEGRTLENVRQVLQLLEEGEETARDELTEELFAKAISDVLSDSVSRLASAHRRLYANTYVVWEVDRQKISFLAGVLRGWGLHQGLEDLPLENLLAA